MTPAAARTRWWVPCDVVAQGLASHRSTGPIEDDRWFQPDDGHWSGRKRRVVAPIPSRLAMNHADAHWTLQTALTYGGSFHKALAAAGLAADPVNRDRVLRAFPEINTTYGPESYMHRSIRNEVVAR